MKKQITELKKQSKKLNKKNLGQKQEKKVISKKIKELKASIQQSKTLADSKDLNDIDE